MRQLGEMGQRPKPGVGEFTFLIQKGDELILCQAQELFVLPKGVVGVETYCCQ